MMAGACSDPPPAPDPTTTTTTTTTTAPSLSDEGPANPAAATATPPIPVRTTASSHNPACRADPHAGVYRPQRLEVVDPCASVSGTVDYSETEADGDIHIGLVVDPQFADHLNIWNHVWQQGQLLVEIVPADRRRGVAAPPNRTHVTIIGPYVLDRAHGWMEIHPAWAVNANAAP
jgi:hypothetical protein